jgi:hypothetical protein
MDCAKLWEKIFSKREATSRKGVPLERREMDNFQAAYYLVKLLCRNFSKDGAQ